MGKSIAEIKLETSVIIAKTNMLRVSQALDKPDPTEAEISKAYATGGAQGIEELYFPGDKAEWAKLIKTLPYPEGTGREYWPKERSVLVYDKGDGYRFGPRTKRDYYFDDIWVGSILNIHPGGFGNSYFATHDGNHFWHYGGETGVYTWLKMRYWTNGNPPKPGFFRSLKAIPIGDCCMCGKPDSAVHDMLRGTCEECHNTWESKRKQ